MTLSGKEMAVVVRSLLRYEPQSGRFVWLVDAAPNAPAGSIAGWRHNRGYWCISVMGRAYLAHRLAWLITHGDWPRAQIDHINGDRSDNQLSNLREVTNAQNAQNKRAARRDNKAGALGVKRMGRGWQSRITRDGKTVSLGVFDSIEQAAAAYVKAKRELHEMGTL